MALILLRCRLAMRLNHHQPRTFGSSSGRNTSSLVSGAFLLFPLLFYHIRMTRITNLSFSFSLFHDFMDFLRYRFYAAFYILKGAGSGLLIAADRREKQSQHTWVPVGVLGCRNIWQ